MTSVRLAIDAFKRLRAGEPEIILRNRFFEANPTNLQEKVALVIRPALRKRTLVGSGPIRRIYYSSGTFNNDAFVVSRSKPVPAQEELLPNGQSYWRTQLRSSRVLSTDDGGLNKSPDMVARHDVRRGRLPVRR
jgi:hypothetical protein